MIKVVKINDRIPILAFVQKQFQKNWVYEVEHALMESVSKCVIATEGGIILGFACFDSSAKGFFGPIDKNPCFVQAK